MGDWTNTILFVGLVVVELWSIVLHQVTFFFWVTFWVQFWNIYQPRLHMASVCPTVSIHISTNILAWSKSKLFAKIISRQQNLQLEGKNSIHCSIIINLAGPYFLLILFLVTNNVFSSLSMLTTLLHYYSINSLHAQLHITSPLSTTWYFAANNILKFCCFFCA